MEKLNCEKMLFIGWLRLMDIHRSYFYYDYKKDVTEVEDAIREAAKKRLPTRVKDPLSAPDIPNTILFLFLQYATRLFRH